MSTWYDPRLRRLVLALDAAMNTPEPRDGAPIRYGFERAPDGAVTMTSEVGDLTARWKADGPIAFSTDAPLEWRAMALRVRKANP
jgi:hypothetical protein